MHFRWWRPVLSLVLLVLLLVGFACVAVGAMMALAWLTGQQVAVTDDAIFANPDLDTVAALVGIALLLPAVLLAVRLAERRPAGTVSSVAGRLRRRWLLTCVVIALPIVVLMIIVLVIAAVALGLDGEAAESASDWVGWPRFVLGAAAVLLVVPFQASAEEYITRGWLVQAVGAYLRTPWPGIVVGAVVFALAHGLSEVSGFVGLVQFGLIMGWLTVRTGGLEAAIAWHASNNVLVFLLAAAFGGLGAGGDTTAADAPWLFPIVELGFFIPYALLVSRWHRRRFATDPGGGNQTGPSEAHPAALEPSR